MKKLLFAILFASALFACQKDSGCPGCEVIVSNAGDYPFHVEVNQIGAGQIAPGETVIRSIPSGRSVLIKGDEVSPFAGYTFTKWVRCNDDCNTILVQMK